MAVETPISVSIGGANVGGSVLSLGTDQDICRVAQTCTIALDPNVASAFNPWDEIVISINGSGRFKGYVDDALRGRKPAEYIVRGTDVMKRALDNYYAEIAQDEAGLWWPNPFVVEEELDAGYWIAYWLEYAGIPSSGAVETGRTVPVGLEWNFIAVSDIILECLGYAGGGWTVIVDGDGVAQISEKAIGAASHSLSGTIAFSRSQEDSWRRDRAVVFGDGVVAEKPEDPAGCTKTVALSSTFIQSRPAAIDLAQDILDFFNEDLDIKRCLIAGNASIWLGETAEVGDLWAGYSGLGLITSIETRVDDRGFRQFVSLDEKCGFIWGHGRPYGQIAFTSEGTLILGDTAPWLICDIPGGITMLNTMAAIKTPSEGAPIETQIETSVDGENWALQHTNVIVAGERLSGIHTGFTEPFVDRGTLVKANVTQIGDEEAGAYSTVSVGIKIGRVSNGDL